MAQEVQLALQLQKMDRQLTQLEAEIRGLPKKIAAMEKQLEAHQRQLETDQAAYSAKHDEMYKIDLVKKTAEKSEWQSLGHGFEASWKGDDELGYKLRFNGKDITVTYDNAALRDQNFDRVRELMKSVRE